MARGTRRHASPIRFRRVELDATPDDPLVRSMLRHGTALEPDPRFARRLRGIVLSRHVAAREGHMAAPRRGSMTPVGRGVLVSSVLLAMSAGTVGAFSQSALPDDPLYPVKLRLESLRMALAPADMQDDLLAMALEERASELTRAAAVGRWNAADEAAWRLVATEEQLVALNGLTPGIAARVQAHLRALDQVLVHAPTLAAAHVAERLEIARVTLRDRGRGSDAPRAAPGTAGSGGGSNAAPDASPPVGEPQRSAAPSAKPAPSAPLPSQPAASDRPAATERPSRSPHATPDGQRTSEAPAN
ncbi:MAG: hypothetical protein ABI622_07890 [Chloroflexota bacterium]